MTTVDWVRDRAKCNVHRLFGELRIQVSHDAEAAKAVTGQPVAVREERTDLFFVTVGDREIGFSLTGSQIEVNAGGILPILARAQFAYPKCKIRLDDGRLLDPWEFSREALEDVFFPVDTTDR